MQYSRQDHWALAMPSIKCMSHAQVSRMEEGVKDSISKAAGCVSQISLAILIGHTSALQAAQEVSQTPPGSGGFPQGARQEKPGGGGGGTESVQSAREQPRGNTAATLHPELLLEGD